MAQHNYHWDEESLEILKREFPFKGKNIPELIERGYSYTAIGKRAFKLGIKLNEEIITLLKDNYPLNGSYIPELISKGFSKADIRNMAVKYNVKYIGDRSYIKERILNSEMKINEINLEYSHCFSSLQLTLKSYKRDGGEKVFYTITFEGDTTSIFDLNGGEINITPEGFFRLHSYICCTHDCFTPNYKSLINDFFIKTTNCLI